MVKMIIDVHTHTFPDKIASRALQGLSDSSRAVPFTDGTVFGRYESMKNAGIDICINLPVATKAHQVESINNIAIDSYREDFTEGIIEFGSMHPDCGNVNDELKRIKNAGVKGIKIHPAFYQLDISDKRIKNIIYEASANNLVIVTHSGWDIGFPEANYIPVNSLLEIDKEINPKKMILAHMGGWNDWDSVEKYLAGSDYYFDTSFSIGPINKRPDLIDPMRTYNMKDKDFVRLCKKHGINKILFGTDCPWSDQKEYVDKINTLDFSNEEKDKIFYFNAKQLLNI